MKKSLLSLMLGIVLCFGSVQEVKAFINGSNILKYCETGNRSLPKLGWEMMSCVAYIDGTIQGFRLGTLVQATSKEKILFRAKLCKPLEMDTTQKALIAIKWLKEHPEMLHLPASSLIIRAFQEAFPCQN